MPPRKTIILYTDVAENRDKWVQLLNDMLEKAQSMAKNGEAANSKKAAPNLDTLSRLGHILMPATFGYWRSRIALELRSKELVPSQVTHDGPPPPHLPGMIALA